MYIDVKVNSAPPVPVRRLRAANRIGAVIRRWSAIAVRGAVRGAVRDCGCGTASHALTVSEAAARPSKSTAALDHGLPVEFDSLNRPDLAQCTMICPLMPNPVMLYAYVPGIVKAADVTVEPFVTTIGKNGSGPLTYEMVRVPPVLTL